LSRSAAGWFLKVARAALINSTDSGSVMSYREFNVRGSWPWTVRVGGEGQCPALTPAGTTWSQAAPAAAQRSRRAVAPRRW
jgi:hypothetical protein